MPVFRYIQGEQESGNEANQIPLHNMRRTSKLKLRRRPCRTGFQGRKRQHIQLHSIMQKAQCQQRKQGSNGVGHTKAVHRQIFTRRPLHLCKGDLSISEGKQGTK